MASFADQVRKSNIKNKDNEFLARSIKQRLDRVKTNKKDSTDIKPAEIPKIQPVPVKKPESPQTKTSEKKPVKKNKELTTELQPTNKEVTGELQPSNKQLTSELHVTNKRVTRESQETSNQVTRKLQPTNKELTIDLQPTNREVTGDLQASNKEVTSSVEFAGSTAIIYEWLKLNGNDGFFANKTIINETFLCHNSIIRAVKSIAGTNAISFSDYNKKTRIKSYNINHVVPVKIIKDSYYNKIKSKINSNNQLTSDLQGTNNQVTGNLQPTNNQLTSDLQGTNNQVTTNSPYIDRKKDLNNLSFYIENSEFWKKDLNIRKCKTWLNEFEDLNPDDLLRELQIGEKHPDINKPNKSKLGLLYTAIKNGGLSKPKGFEFPEEKRLRKRKEKLEIELQAQKELEEIENQALELENKKTFELEIKNQKTLESLINELLIPKSFFKSTRTKKSLETYKKTGELDLNLKTILRKEYLKN